MADLFIKGQLPQNIKRVFYTGTDAISQGEGVCYDYDYDDGSDPADAADAWTERAKYVAAPSATNNLSFAGVVLRDYAANASGQYIEIAVPEGINRCICLAKVVDSSTTIGEGNFLWCLGGSSADAGQWTATPQGFAGRGSARILQTLSTAGLCLVQLMDGAESGLVEKIATATLTAGGAITCMVGGATFFDGPATPASDCTFTLADGTFIGQTKRFYQDGDLTTNDVLITVTSGEQLDGATDLASLELDGDADDSTLIWTGTTWRLLGNAGTGLA